MSVVTLDARPIACNLCGADDEARIVPVESSWYVRCRGCGLVYIDPQPSPAAIAALYSEDYFTHSDGISYGYTNYVKDRVNILRTFHRRYRYIERSHRPGRLLDVGCAYGYSLVAARERGWDALGLELAADVVQIAREEVGVAVEQGTLEQFAERGEQFDVVTLWDVIEHVSDPAAVLRAARRLVRPGGRLVMMTPNVAGVIARVSGKRWVMFQRGCIEHLYYFSPRTMRAMLERCGFRTLRCRSWGWGGKYVDLEFILTRLAFYQPRLFGVVQRLLRRWGWSGWSLYADIGDNMVVIAEPIEHA